MSAHMELVNRVATLKKELQEAEAALAASTVEVRTVNLGGLGHYTHVTEKPQFKPSPFPVSAPKDGIFKPTRNTDAFWPAIRARNMVKALNPDLGRQTFDANIRYMADRLHITPEELLKTNPIPIGRRLGLSDLKLSSFMDNFFYKYGNHY